MSLDSYTRVLALLCLASCTGEVSVDGGGLDAATAARDGGLADSEVPTDSRPMGDDAGPHDAGPFEVADAGTFDAGPPPRCASAPECASATAPVSEHRMVPLDGCHFVLDAPDVAAGAARADALLSRTSGARDVDFVLGHLNRVGREGISSDNANRMRNHEWVGFRWNTGDEAVDYWYPQGISGSSDAQASARADGRRLLLVSWYHRTDVRPTKGARLSLVDITDLSDVRYRHLLLVTPTSDGSDFGPAESPSGGALHAGGIVWLGDKLYVADTSRGLRVYDLSRIFEVSHTDDTDRVGVSGTRIDAHGYRFAVPELARYQLASDSCSVRFSFVGLDRSADPQVLISGEYHTPDVEGRVVRWPLDASTGWLQTEGARAHGLDAAVSGQSRMQGALTYEGVYYFSSSSQYEAYGRLYRSRPGLESVITAWPRGCEDLYVERDQRLIWTAAEHPGTRDTLGIPLQGR